MLSENSEFGTIYSIIHFYFGHLFTYFAKIILNMISIRIFLF